MLLAAISTIRVLVAGDGHAAWQHQLPARFHHLHSFATSGWYMAVGESLAEFFPGGFATLECRCRTTRQWLGWRGLVRSSPRQLSQPHRCIGSLTTRSRFGGVLPDRPFVMPETVRIDLEDGQAYRPEPQPSETSHGGAAGPRLTLLKPAVCGAFCAASPVDRG
jgi:hypothetical protein